MVTARLLKALDDLSDAVESARKSRSRRRPWTAIEDEIMRDYYPHVPAAFIATAINRTASSVYQRSRLMGLGKSPEFFESPMSGRTGHDDRGKSGRFSRGFEPWNKGRKGWDAGGNSSKTRFRPGNRPHNWKPIGHERICKDGYVWRKVRDNARPSTYNYEPVHVLVWRQHNGEVPKGMNLVFRNGNRRDTSIENLELLSDANLMRRNTRHRYGPEINAAIHAKAVLTRRINKLERKSA